MINFFMDEIKTKNKALSNDGLSKASGKWSVTGSIGTRATRSPCEWNIDRTCCEYRNI